MSRQAAVFLACAATATTVGLTTSPAFAQAAGETHIEATVTVDAAQVLRTMDPRRLGGTNVGTWYRRWIYQSPEVRQWMAELNSAYIRMPGGSGSNMFYWNGNGVRDAQGNVDPSRVGPDGYPAVDYSGFAPSFIVDLKTLHPAAAKWDPQSSDAKTQHDLIKATPGAQAMVCPNAATGRPVDAAEWVKWANKTMDYNVRYWEIGNELDGSWEPGYELPFGKGHFTAEMYTRQYNDMANAMRKMDPTIKIGTCPFVKETLRDCGENVDFVSVHNYPGSTTLSDAQMFADISRTVQGDVDRLRGWIRQYQPQREKQIEIAYTEWNLGFSVSKSQLFSGLWASIFLGELARNGVDMATEWDCFSDLMDLPENGPKTRKAEYYALSLWNNYMGQKLISANSSDQAVYTYASRSEDAVTVMLINTDPDREAKVSLQLSGFTPADSGELATLTHREYYWSLQTSNPRWSTGPRIERLATGGHFGVTLSPFSMTYVRIPDQAKPALSPMAQKALATTRPPAAGAAELRFVMPAEAYAGDAVSGDLIALASGSETPHPLTLAPAALSASGEAAFDRQQVRLADAVGHFSVKPTVPGELTVTAQSGGTKATHKILVKPSVPRPIVFWDFTNPPVTDKGVFSSSYALHEDLTQRANRAVARVDLPAPGARPDVEDKHRFILSVGRLPEAGKLNKANIRGVIADVKTSADFECEDPNASILVVMQGPANWWMKIGTIPLNNVREWKSCQLDITTEEHFKALPTAGNVIFVLQTGKPPKGSIYLDRIGFMVR